MKNTINRRYFVNRLPLIVNMAYLILIPTSASENLDILKKNKTWGFEPKIVNQIDLSVGTQILFFYGLRYDGTGKAPKGFPRLKSWDKVDIKIEKIIHATVTSGIQKNNSFFGERYNMVFSVKTNRSITDVHKTIIPDEIIELLRLSTTSSKPRKFNSKLIDKIFKES